VRRANGKANRLPINRGFTSRRYDGGLREAAEGLGSEAMGHHWGHRRRFAPTKHVLARLGLRHDDGGAEQTPPAAEVAGEVVAASPQAPPRTRRTGRLGALVRDGLSRLLAVNF